HVSACEDEFFVVAVGHLILINVVIIERCGCLCRLTPTHQRVFTAGHEHHILGEGARLDEFYLNLDLRRAADPVLHTIQFAGYRSLKGRISIFLNSKDVLAAGDSEMVDWCRANSFPRRRATRFIHRETLEVYARSGRLAPNRQVIRDYWHEPGNCRFI